MGAELSAAANKQTENKPGPGRPAGSPNKTTKALKEAILAAAESVGSDGNGEGGLEGYLQDLAKTDRRVFAGLLGKVLPHEIKGEISSPTMTKEHRDAVVAAAMRVAEFEVSQRTGADCR